MTREFYNYETDEKKLHVFTMGEVLQVFLGCPALPLDITTGLIEFDHNTMALPTFHTCGPSIKIARIQSLQNYREFEDTFGFAVIGSRNFFGQYW